MPQPDHFKFNYKELATLMIKAAGVKEGYWGVRVAFALQATNIGPDKDSLVPGAVILTKEIGLQRFDEDTSLCVDAATVWHKEDQNQ